jgi:hypothetical protein
MRAPQHAAPQRTVRIDFVHGELRAEPSAITLSVRSHYRPARRMAARPNTTPNSFSPSPRVSASSSVSRI